MVDGWMSKAEEVQKICELRSLVGAQAPSQITSLFVKASALIERVLAQKVQRRPMSDQDHNVLALIKSAARAGLFCACLTD